MPIVLRYARFYRIPVGQPYGARNNDIARVFVLNAGRTLCGCRDCQATTGAPSTSKKCGRIRIQSAPNHVSHRPAVNSLSLTGARIQVCGRMRMISALLLPQRRRHNSLAMITVPPLAHLFTLDLWHAGLAVVRCTRRRRVRLGGPAPVNQADHWDGCQKMLEVTVSESILATQSSGGD